jgi:hypothetical protein
MALFSASGIFLAPCIKFGIGNAERGLKTNGYKKSSKMENIYFQNRGNSHCRQEGK